MGPNTIAALNGLLSTLLNCACSRLVVATDANKAGVRYADQVTEKAATGVRIQQACPRNGRNDWNDELKARGGDSLIPPPKLGAAGLRPPHPNTN
jgi:Toprim-like